jgi:hypothetical protein
MISRPEVSCGSAAGRTAGRTPGGEKEITTERVRAGYRLEATL